jgi:hypothetical protein
MAVFSPDEGDTLHNCMDCGASYVIKAGEREWLLGKGLTLPKRCSGCRALKREQGPRVDTSRVIEERVCVDCNVLFTVTENEANWLKERGYVASSRCRDCRARRNQERKQLQSANAQAEVARVWRD